MKACAVALARQENTGKLYFEIVIAGNIRLYSIKVKDRPELETATITVNHARHSERLVDWISRKSVRSDYQFVIDHIIKESDAITNARPLPALPNPFALHTHDENSSRHSARLAENPLYDIPVRYQAKQPLGRSQSARFQSKEPETNFFGPLFSQGETYV